MSRRKKDPVEDAVDRYLALTVLDQQAFHRDLRRCEKWAGKVSSPVPSRGPGRPRKVTGQPPTVTEQP